jgi:hypothetical protein
MNVNEKSLAAAVLPAALKRTGLRYWEGAKMRTDVSIYASKNEATTNKLSLSWRIIHCHGQDHSNHVCASPAILGSTIA